MESFPFRPTCKTCGWLRVIGWYASCHRPETPCCDKVNVQGRLVFGVGCPTEKGNFQGHLANAVWLPDDCCPLFPYKFIRCCSISWHNHKEVVRGKREKVVSLSYNSMEGQTLLTECPLVVGLMLSFCHEEVQKHWYEAAYLMGIVLSH